MRQLWLGALLALGTASAGAGPALAADTDRADAALDRALRELVAAPGGPPGAIAVIQRGDRRQVHTAGVANRRDRARLAASDHMRVASVSKAFSGATALALVDEGVLALDDPIGRLLPELPGDWHRVSLRQLLNHTSGLPDFTGTEAFAEAVGASPTIPPPPRDLLGFVEHRPLEFRPGSEYRYSNSDNIVVGLLVEAATGGRYERSLSAKALGPLGLRSTELLRAGGVVLPSPFIHGYSPGDRGAPEDVSQLVAFGGWAWASGGIVSTPGDLNRFVRGYVGGRLFGSTVQREQQRFVAGGRSEPRGPGRNGAGLGLFRYRTSCGRMFGHTGSILGYTQLIAASAGGRRSLDLHDHDPGVRPTAAATQEGAGARRLRRPRAPLTLRRFQPRARRPSPARSSR